MKEELRIDGSTLEEGNKELIDTVEHLMERGIRFNLEYTDGRNWTIDLNKEDSDDN